jgi:hypothetical protein
MFDYNGFNASGNLGGYTISIGGGGGYTPYPTQYPTTYPTQYPTYPPVSYGGVGGGMENQTMWILLGVVALFVLASK